MSTFTLKVFSVAIGDFRTAIDFGFLGARFELDAPTTVQIDSDNGRLDSVDHTGTRVKIGDDDQGPITAISFRAISVTGDDGVVNIDVAVIERRDVATFLLVPIDRNTGRIDTRDVPPSNQYATGDTFELASFSIEADVVLENSPPVTQPDVFEVSEDQNDGNPSLFNVLTNPDGADSDPDGDDIRVVSFTAEGNTLDLPAGQQLRGITLGNGTLRMNSEGLTTFTATDAYEDLGAGDSVTLDFSYVVEDSEGARTEQTSKIVVNGVNDAPEAVSGEFGVAFEGRLEGAVTATDVDDEPGELTYEVVEDPQNGSLDLDENGNFSFEPNAGFSGSDSFTFVAIDAEGARSESEIFIFVEERDNQAPVAADFDVTVSEDGTVGVDILGNASDADGDDLSVELGDPENGTVAFDDEEFRYTPNADFSGTDSFTYTVRDGNGGTDTGTVSVTVDAVNDDPVGADDSFSTDENTAFTTGNVLTNDIDVDGDTLSVSALDTTGTLGLVTDNGDGTFDYDPNGAFETLVQGQTAIDTFTYTAIDGNGGISSATVMVSIAGVDSGPIAVDDFVVTTEDINVQFNILSGVGGGSADIGVEDLTLSVVRLFDSSGELYINNAGGPEDTFRSIFEVPEGGNAVLTTGGRFTFFTNGDYDYLAAGESIDVKFSYVVNDGITAVNLDGPTDTGNIVITVNGVNDAPDAADFDVTVSEDGTVGVDILGNASDADGDDLSVELGDPENGTVAFDDEEFRYTPNADFNGTDSFTYTVRDGNGGTDTGTVSVTVDAVNDDPVGVADETSVQQGQSVTVDLVANDTDIDSDVPLILGAVAEPTLGEGMIEVVDGKLVFTAADDFVGKVTLGYQVLDGDGGSGTSEVTFTVTKTPNQAPVGADDSFTITESETVVGNLITGAGGASEDSDPDGDTLSIVAARDVNGNALVLTNGNMLASGGQLAIGTDGAIFFDPLDDFDDLDAGEMETVSFTYDLSDGTEIETVSVSIQIEGLDVSNTAPVAVDDTNDVTGRDNIVYNVLLGDADGGADRDADGDDLVVTSYTFNGIAREAGFGLEDGALGFFAIAQDGTVEGFGERAVIDALGGDETLTIDVGYTISDGALTDDATLSITFNGVNDAPIAEDDAAQTDADTTIDINVLANDADVDGDALTVSVAATALATELGSVSVNPDGTVNFVPGSALAALALGTSQTVMFDYTVSDGEFEDTATVSVLVEGTFEEIGPNVIEGSSGRDYLVGTNDADVIVAGGGVGDILRGLDGVDTFDFADNLNNGIRDYTRILDFQESEILSGFSLEDVDLGTLRSRGNLTQFSYGEDNDVLVIVGELPEDPADWFAMNLG